MPTSDAVITRENLVKRAFRRIGMDTPSTNEKSLAVDLLNDIVKEIDVEGRWLWAITNTESSLTLVSGQRAYAAGSGASLIATDILEFESVVIERGTTRIPLRIIGKSESLNSFELETVSGEPYMVHLEKSDVMASQRALFLPTPNAADTIKYTYRRRLYDFDNASDNPDFPQDWAQRLTKRLSYELAPEYGIPDQTILRLKSEMDEAMRKGHAANAEKVTPTPVYAEYF